MVLVLLLSVAVLVQQLKRVREANVKANAETAKADLPQLPTTLEELVGTAQACEEAGSRCSYPVGAPDAASLQRILDALAGPVNVIANPRKGSAAGSLEDLQVMGVHRVTFGPLLQKELAPDLAALVTPWK